MFSKSCALREARTIKPCSVPMKVKAEVWKSTQSVRIVTDWLS